MFKFTSVRKLFILVVLLVNEVKGLTEKTVLIYIVLESTFKIPPNLKGSSERNDNKILPK